MEVTDSILESAGEVSGRDTFVVSELRALVDLCAYK
jgi:hypothetical protein